jgi:hypothetical protein
MVSCRRAHPSARTDTHSLPFVDDSRPPRLHRDRAQSAALRAHHHQQGSGRGCSSTKTDTIVPRCPPRATSPPPRRRPPRARAASACCTPSPSTVARDLRGRCVPHSLEGAPPLCARALTQATATDAHPPPSPRLPSQTPPKTLQVCVGVTSPAEPDPTYDRREALVRSFAGDYKVSHVLAQCAHPFLVPRAVCLADPPSPPPIPPSPSDHLPGQRPVRHARRHQQQPHCRRRR